MNIRIKTTTAFIFFSFLIGCAQSSQQKLSQFGKPFKRPKLELSDMPKKIDPNLQNLRSNEIEVNRLLNSIPSRQGTTSECSIMGGHIEMPEWDEVGVDTLPPPKSACVKGKPLGDIVDVDCHCICCR